MLKNTRLSVGSGLVLAFGNIARVELNYVYPLWKNTDDKYEIFCLISELKMILKYNRF